MNCRFTVAYLSFSRLDYDAHRDRVSPHGESPPTPPYLRITYTAVRLFRPDSHPATSIQSGFQKQYRRSKLMSIQTLPLRDPVSYLPLAFTVPSRGWHRSGFRWWLYGLAYLLLRLSPWSASLTSPDNPSILPSADYRYAIGFPYGSLSSPWNTYRLSRGTPDNLHRVTAGIYVCRLI
jgi:hypothetical protein